MAAMFKAWEPVEIEPQSEENREDMRLVLAHRLRHGGPDGCSLVAEADLPAAVDLMLDKSAGQFVWLKFAFDTLASKRTGGEAPKPGQGGEEGGTCPAAAPWRLEELVVVLADGLMGTYRTMLTSVRTALVRSHSPADQALWPLLHGRLLPLLLVACEPLTPRQLAALAGTDDQGAVDRALGLVAGLFPSSPGGSDGEPRVMPYHKSVLDWLGSSEHAGKELCVQASTGHSLAAQACCALAGSASAAAANVAEPSPLSQYVLLYAVRHACLALHSASQPGEAVALLDRLLLSFPFWEAVFAAGGATPTCSGGEGGIDTDSGTSIRIQRPDVANLMGCLQLCMCCLWMCLSPSPTPHPHRWGPATSFTN